MIGQSILVQRDWYCPNCKLVDHTAESRPHVRMHPCPRLSGIVAPMLPAGVSAKVEVIERQDYVGTDIIQRDDNGRAVMSVVTTRDDGQDCIVFAPTVVARIA